jgi:hypothetical protein
MRKEEIRKLKLLNSLEEIKSIFIKMPKSLQEIHERIPGLREMMYGKDKARYAPSSLSKNLRRQYLLEELRTLSNGKAQEYLKFTKDIRQYDFSKPIPTTFLTELDFDDIRESMMKYGTYLCYDDALFIDNDMYKIYVVKDKKKHFICVYRFGRYYDDILRHPSTKLLVCIPIQA